MIRPGKMVGEVIRHIGRKPVTLKYPAVKISMPKNFRGRLVFDSAKCIGCKMCMRDCPANAINIRKVGDKKFECDISVADCIMCAQCVDTCPKKALAATGEFELAQVSKDKLKLVFHAAPSDEPEKKG